MDFKEIKNTKHYLYDDRDEFLLQRPDIPVRHNWRHGDEGEWVFTDDGYVCQILRKSDISKKKDSPSSCVRTVCGTYINTDLGREMLGGNGIPDNIYSFSGTFEGQDKFNDKKRNSRELLFARYVASGVGSGDAYKLAYPDSRASRYIKRRSESLLKTKEVQKMVKQEIRKILDSEGVTHEWIVERYKTIADLAERDTDKLRSLEGLAKMAGMFDTDEKKSEQVTIWSGFSPEQLAEAKKHGNTELIAHAERDQKEESE